MSPYPELLWLNAALAQLEFEQIFLPNPKR
jgi:hypothetical protein